MSRVYAISDIHGFYDEMKDTLSLVNLKSDNTNIIIFCGDYIDRGLNSFEVLSYIKKLEEKYPDQVKVLIGNHDQMFLDFMFGDDLSQWISYDADLRTTKSFFNSNDEFKELLKKAIAEHSYEKMSTLFKDSLKRSHEELLSWLWGKRNNFFYETSKQIYVHAGIVEVPNIWKLVTPPEDFTWKRPKGKAKSFFKDIVAGHNFSYLVANDISFLGKIFYDNSHFFIDGATVVSGRIPLLKYDTKNKIYTSFEKDDNDNWNEVVIKKYD